jgi:segregation and condensation protein B
LESEERSSATITIPDSENRVADLFDEEYALATESILFTSPQPLTEIQISRIVGCDRILVGAIVEKLNRQYAEWGRTFKIEKFGDGYRLFTLPDYDKYVARLAEIPRPIKLSRAALEVLAVAAYRQPVVKSEIDRIRGIDSSGVLRTLVERGLIAISGRSDGPGRPLLYTTTQEFLDFFGITNLSDLPNPELTEGKEESPNSLVLVRPPENIELNDTIDSPE